jgi:ribosomal-protein-alanine N-acetyltransferase
VLPTGPRVYLERPSARREADFLTACRLSRALHRGLVAPVSTPEDYRAYLKRAAQPSQESFFVVAAGSHELAGAVNILDVNREGAPAGRLAWFAFAPHAGRGFMHLGLRAVIDVAFADLGLARLEADIEPRNRRSRALAERLGFGRDAGPQVARKIGSRWRMHERWTLSRDGGARRAQEPELRA